MENEIQQLLNFSILFIGINSVLLIFNHKLVKIVNIYDKPDKKRKFHHGKPSIIGGIYLFLNLILFFLLAKINYFSNINFFLFNDLTFLISLVLIFLIGIFDDKYVLKANSKLSLLCVSIFISVITNSNFLVENINFITFDRNIHLHDYSYFFTLLCILLFMNSFNMMDGTNSLAGSYSLIFLLYFLVFINFSSLILVLVIFLIFYLYLNSRNLIFFGDSGSLLLSFLIAVMIIHNHNLGNILAEEIFILMLIPGLDMLRLFITRILNKKNPFRGDRNHLHHLLLNKFNNSKTVLFYNCFFIINLILYNSFNNKIILIITLIIVYWIIIYSLINLKKK